MIINLVFKVNPANLRQQLYLYEKVAQKLITVVIGWQFFRVIILFDCKIEKLFVEFFLHCCMQFSVIH